MWEDNANYVQYICGGHVDWDERFYICPECEEPVYECDWDEDELREICPICGFEGKDEDEEKDFEVTISVTYTVSAKTPEQAKEFASEMFMNNINCSNFDVEIVE